MVRREARTAGSGKGWTRGSFLAGELGRHPPVPLPPLAPRPSLWASWQLMESVMGWGYGKERKNQAGHTVEVEGMVTLTRALCGWSSHTESAAQGGLASLPQLPGEAVGGSLPPSSQLVGGPGCAGHSENRSRGHTGSLLG